MPTHTILFPSGDGTGTFEAIGGPSERWQTVNSGIVEPLDSTYLRSSGVEVTTGGETQFFGLEEFPSNFNAIGTISGIVRLRVHNQADDYNLALQFFESDETTPLTYPSGKDHSSGGVFQSSEGTFQNHVFNFDISGGDANRPCAWTDAMLKMSVTCENIDSPLDISEMQVNIYHTTGCASNNCCDCVSESGCCCYWDGSNFQSQDWSSEADCLSRQPRGYFVADTVCASVDCSVVEPTGQGRYSCVDPQGTTSDRCVEDDFGDYGNITDCLAACVPSWNCVDGACLEDLDGGGTYSSLAACESACWYYKCNVPPDGSPRIPPFDTAETTCTQAEDGEYPTAELCLANCTTTTTTTQAPSDDCCQWDGDGILAMTGVCNFQVDIQFTEGPDNTWSFNGLTPCGDPVDASLSCNPAVDVGPDKWTLNNFNMPCAPGATYLGQTPGGCWPSNPPGTCSLPWECDEAPAFWFDLPSFNDCLCCNENCLLIEHAYYGSNGSRLKDEDGHHSPGFGCNMFTNKSGSVGAAMIDEWGHWSDGIHVPSRTHNESFIRIMDGDGSLEVEMSPRSGPTITDDPVEGFSGILKISARASDPVTLPIGSVLKTGTVDLDFGASTIPGNNECGTDGFQTVQVAWERPEEDGPFTLDRNSSMNTFIVPEYGVGYAGGGIVDFSAILLCVYPSGNPPPPTSGPKGACCYEEENHLGQWLCICENNLTEAECKAKPEGPTFSLPEWYEDRSCHTVRCECD